MLHAEDGRHNLNPPLLSNLEDELRVKKGPGCPRNWGEFNVFVTPRTVGSGVGH